MLSIRTPSRHEVLEAMINLENGDKLTDREIWILSQQDEEDEFE